MISYRKANAEDIYPALELALKVFMEYNAPGYEPISILNFKTDCVDNQSYIDSLKSGENVMFVNAVRLEIKNVCRIIGQENHRYGSRTERACMAVIRRWSVPSARYCDNSDG